MSRTLQRGDGEDLVPRLSSQPKTAQTYFCHDKEKLRLCVSDIDLRVIASNTHREDNERTETGASYSRLDTYVGASIVELTQVCSASKEAGWNERLSAAAFHTMQTDLQLR